MASTACRPQTIFESATVEVQHCPDCQMIHLTMGSFTVRMSEQHFSQYAKDISKSLFEFSGTRGAQPTMHLIM